MEIRIKESAFRHLLDREQAVADAKHAFPEQLDLLREVVNYGSNLLPRCFGSSNKELKDLVLIGILTRQVIVMLDAIELLLSNGSVYAAGLQARALFEAAVSIDWVLQGDAEKKTMYYYVHDIRRQRRWVQRSIPGSADATTFAALAPDLASMRDPKLIEHARNRLKEIDRFLSKPEYEPINSAFDASIRKKAKSDAAWYVPLGIRSISGMMKSVGKSAEYVVFYNSWSETMHSSNFREHVEVGDGRVTLIGFRLLTGFDSLFRFSVATAFHVFRKMLEEYRPGEINVFNRKYLEGWRKAFMQVPKISYQSKSAPI